MKQEVMSPFILSASLQDRAGIWHHGRANGGSCTSKPVLVSVQGESGLPRGTGQVGAGSWRHEHTSPTCPDVLQDSPLQSCCDWFHGKGHSSSPEGTEAPLILALNFLLSLLTFCQSCFQGNLSPSLLCCRVGVVWNEEKHWNQQHKFGFFVWVFENLKKYPVALPLSQHWLDVISERDFCGQTLHRTLMFNAPVN